MRGGLSPRWCVGMVEAGMAVLVASTAICTRQRCQPLFIDVSPSRMSVLTAMMRSLNVT